MLTRLHVPELIGEITNNEQATELQRSHHLRNFAQHPAKTQAGEQYDKQEANDDAKYMGEGALKAKVGARCR